MGFFFRIQRPLVGLERHSRKRCAKAAILLTVGFAELNFSGETPRDGVIVVLHFAAARVLQVEEWFHYFWKSAF